MSPRFWQPAPVEHHHAPFRDVDCLVEELAETLGRLPPGSARATVVEGELAGLRAKGAAPIRPKALAGSPDYRSGYLAGHLLGKWLREDQTLPPQALTFAVAFARVLVEPGVEEMFGLKPPENAIGAHTVAWTQTVKKAGALSPELRRSALDWLREGLGVTISPGRSAAVEKRWQERESCQETPLPATIGTRAPLTSIRIVAGASPYLPGHMSADTPSIAFGLSDLAWHHARELRFDAASSPITEASIRGFFEMRVGDRSVLSKAGVSVFGVARSLARARIDGFPDAHPICVVDDCTGSWALHMVRDPIQPVVQVTEIYRGASAPVEVGALADLIDAFLHRFVREASARITDVTGWGELGVLAGYRS
jgi:hypothetical protein